MRHSTTLLPVAVLVCWLALWGVGDCFDFEECTKPCWEVYNLCRSNQQLASCNPPMAQCMDNCSKLKDQTARDLLLRRRLANSKRLDDNDHDFNDMDRDGWND